MSYVPHDLYTIYLHNHAGEVVLLIQNYTRLEYHQRNSSSWNHHITVEMSVDDPRVTTYREIQKDWILRIFRTDPVTLVNTLVYEGFNTTIVDQLRINGDIIFNLYGVGYTDLLRRRIVIPPAGSEYSTKTGNAETVIKGYVADSTISPTDTDRIFPGMSVESDSGSGNIVTYDARYIILYSICQTLSERGGIDFGVVGGNDVGEFIFKASPVWGKDKRENNLEGNQPIIFSIENDNMIIPILSINTSSEQNYAYVGGTNQGADRVIQEVSTPDAIALSPWGRKEVFVEARQQTDTQALISTGISELNSRKTKQELTFNIQQSVQSRWIRDWVLGDLVTAKYFDYTFEKQIVEVGVTVTAGATSQQVEVITVELEDIEKTVYA
jgi:hypothetical protein